MSDTEIWQKRVERERSARIQAETLLESKSRELFTLNESLQKARNSLEIEVQQRTAELSETIKKLEHEVRRRKSYERELEQSRDTAVAMARSKSDFLARMSHEIRTPLNAVCGLSEILLKSRLEDDQQYKLRMVRDSSRMLLRIINDILVLSSLEANKLHLTYAPAELNRTIDECLDLVKLEAEKKQISFEVSLPYSTPDTLVIDSGRLQQILLNLLSNAINYSDGGSITVKCKLLPVVSPPATLPDGLEKYYSTNATSHALQYLQIAVTDQGRGILPEEIGNLFKPFSNLKTTSIGSTGLGLSICKRLSELMGGKIEVDSTYGKGSTFTFELLCSIPKAGPTLPETRAVSTHGRPGDTRTDTYHPLTASDDMAREKPLRILLADDFEMNRIVQLFQLEQLGYRADTVTNGEEVLRALEAKSYDVVLMDIRMPVLDGVATTKRIRSNTKIAQPYIIAVTASALPEDQQNYLEAGIDNYVAKPVEFGKLQNALEAAWATLAKDKIRTVTYPEAAGKTTIDLEAVSKRLGPAAFKLLARVIPVYIREMPGREHTLRAAAKSRNAEEFSRICHGLKSSSFSVGAITLGEEFGNLEMRGYQNQLPGEAELDALFQLASSTIRGLDELLALISESPSLA